MTSGRRVLPALLALAGACGRASAPDAGLPVLPPGVEAISLLGDTLRAFPLDSATRARYEAQLDTARAALSRAPEDRDSLVWVGRRLGYLGRAREAIATYTRGLATHPDDPWLLRHRGHRWITVREFDRAIADLSRAARLVRGRPDEVEPDGQPNARNRPIGTLQSNIDYHLALAHYLAGDWAAALPVHEREARRAANDDRRVSIAYWQYLALRRLGRDAEARAVLDSVAPATDVIENGAYRDLLRHFRGELPADSLLPHDEDGALSVASSTTAYGLGAFRLVEGDTAAALDLFRCIVEGGQWGAFGHIAAEAELARLRSR